MLQESPSSPILKPLVDPHRCLEEHVELGRGSRDGVEVLRGEMISSTGLKSVAGLEVCAPS